MTHGERIINFIIENNLVATDGEVLVWSGNSIEQLDALIDTILKKEGIKHD